MKHSKKLHQEIIKNFKVFFVIYDSSQLKSLAKTRKLSARSKTQLGEENLKKIRRIKRILKICSDPAGDFSGKVNEEYVNQNIKQEIVDEINNLYTT